MARTLHNVLNTVLPMGMRERLRESAKAFIPSLRHLDMPARLYHLAAQGLRPGVVYDVGAASGEWARLAHQVWPQARIIGFEPNKREKESLERTKREVPGFDYRLCFLGRESKTVEYHDNDTRTSLMHQAAEGPKTTSMMCVLDELIANGDIPAPDFMKLDVQGFELEVLAGATKAIEGCRAMMLEVSFVPFTPTFPQAAEIIHWMKQRGFEWADVLGILRGPRDDMLWQMDALFLRANDPLRKVNA